MGTQLQTAKTEKQIRFVNLLGDWMCSNPTLRLSEQKLCELYVEAGYTGKNDKGTYVNANKLRKKLAEDIRIFSAEQVKIHTAGAVAVLVNLMHSEDEKVRLQAASSILDRAGLKGATEINVNKTETVSVTDIDKQLLELLKPAQGEVIDAEVIRDE